MKKRYEFETSRRNVTPRQFYRWVVTEFKKRTGEELPWLGDFDQWADPLQPSDDRWEHEWGKEISKTLPYDWHLYAEGLYNFIMEFEYWDDTKGWGYCYAVETE